MSYLIDNWKYYKDKQISNTKLDKVSDALKKIIDIDHDYMIGNFKIIDENHSEIIDIKKRLKKLEEKWVEALLNIDNIT